MNYRFIPFFGAILSLTMISNASAQWIPINGPYGGNYRALGTFGTTLFAGGAVLRSTDTGNTWKDVTGNLKNNDQGNDYINAFAFIGSTIFIGTEGGVFRSQDSGNNWEVVGGGDATYSFATSGTELFAGTWRGVFRSRDTGASWTELDSGLTNKKVNALTGMGTIVFAGTDSGIFRLANNSTTWMSIDSGLANTAVLSFAIIGTNIFAGTKSNGVFHSTDSGSTWTLSSSGLAHTYVYSLVVSGTNLFAGTDSSIFRSTDSGKSWKSSKKSPTLPVLALAAMGTNLFAGTDGEGIYRSIDSGNAWNPSSPSNTEVIASAVIGQRFIAGTYRGVFSTPDDGASWTASPGSIRNSTISTLFLDGPFLFAGTNSGSGLFRSTDSSKNWVLVDSTLQGGTFTSIETSLFTVNGGVFRSTDSGLTWLPSSYGLNDSDVFSLATFGTNLFAGSYKGYIYRSIDLGRSWDSVWSGSQDVFTAFGPNLYAITHEGLFRSKDSGTTWLEVSSETRLRGVQSIIELGANLFAGAFSTADSFNGVYRSTDSGSTWTGVNLGLPNSPVNALVLDDSNLIVATDLGLWRRPLSEMIGSSAVAESAQPVESQAQAYPNPFPEKTSVHFTMAERGPAQITIVNLLGQQVAQLFDGELDAGEHSFEWDASGAAAGTYFCNVRTNDRVVQAAMVLAR